MYNTMNCKMEHDKCRSTELFQLAGQNLAEASGNNGDEWIIETRPIHWFAENENADMSDITYFKSVLAPNGYVCFCISLLYHFNIFTFY